MRSFHKILVIIAVMLGALVFANPAAASLTYTFTSGTDVAVTGYNYTASGALNLTLAFTPTPGTNLTVVKNTGLPFISGTFNGVPQGGTVPLTFNGQTYNYIANYYGGNGRSFVLQWPFIGLDAWGSNGYGQLGNNSTTNSSIPVAVNVRGPLADNRVIGIAGGGNHSLALTSDGQVFAWGRNDTGQLGNNSTINSYVPVSVSASGLLADKIVVAVSAGNSHSLALTSDGQVYAWGYNYEGELGNNSGTNSSVPVAVNTSGALAGKTVVAIAAGGAGGGHSLALTSDGRVYAWGYNYYGQLGNGNTTNSHEPVEVDITGAMAGTTIVAIACGSLHSLALSSDGQIFSWGDNYWAGELGNNSNANSSVPLVASNFGALAGKTAQAVAAGGNHSLVLTTDGQIFAWGSNYYGELGNNSSTNSPIPVAVSSTGALAGKAVTALAVGGGNSWALTKEGQLFAWGNNSSGQFGTNSSTNSSVPVAASASGVMAGKAVVGIAAGNDHSMALFGSGAPSVTANPVNQLAMLTETSSATLRFMAAATENLWPSVQWQVSSTGTAGPFCDIVGNVTATTGVLTLTNVTLAQDGYAYRAIFTNNAGSCTTTAAISSVLYEPDMQATFTSSTDIPFSADVISVSGSLTLALGFTPAPGTNLTVINNTGPAAISGTFSNVPQGGTIRLSYNGVTYNYIANYNGGNGRSLVLQYPCTGIFVWGLNDVGQLGIGGTGSYYIPVSVSKSGALLVNTTVAVAGGGSHSLALSSSGRVYDWGSNSNGQLGNSGTANSYLPTAVYRTGVLTGKTVVAIAGGGSHSLALTSDGRVFAWGCNSYGQLGNSGTANSTQPVAVYPDGELKGQMVVAIAVGKSHSLALTSDGQVFSWGYNNYGQLGNSGTANSSVPVAVSALAGQTVRAIAGGESHSLALTSGGQVFAWGYNNHGQLGTGNTTNTSVPVAINTSGSNGRTVVAIAGGGLHSLALTSDGKVLGWGYNNCGQLANSGTASVYTHYQPRTLSFQYTSLNGKTVAGIAAGYSHSLALTSDGQVFAWGYSANGELGTGGPWSNWTPMPVYQYQGGELSGKTVMAIAAGSSHNLAMFTSGPPSVTTNPINKTGTSGTTVSFAAAATTNPAPSVQWQVSTTGTDGVFSNIVGNASATTGTLTLSGVSLAQNGYAYRAVFTNLAGSCTTDAATLTVQRTFGWFQGRYGLLNADPTADTNRTGVCNLAAYAFGVDPGAPDRAQLPLATVQGGGLQISYPRWKDAADVGYVVEVSDDLQTWHSGADYTEPVSVTPIDATREQVVERDRVPIANAPRRFIRVRITH